MSNEKEINLWKIDYKGHELKLNLEVITTETIWDELQELAEEIASTLIPKLKKRFHELVDSEEVGVLALNEKLFTLPAINIFGKDYLVDIKSRAWWNNRTHRKMYYGELVPGYISTAIEYKMFKLDPEIIAEYVQLSNSLELVQSILLNKPNHSSLTLNKILRLLIEDINTVNWYYFCEKVILSKGFEFFFSSDNKSVFTPQDLFGEDNPPQKLLNILYVSLEEFIAREPLFYLYNKHS